MTARPLSPAFSTAVRFVSAAWRCALVRKIGHIAARAIRPQAIVVMRGTSYMPGDCHRTPQSRRMPASGRPESGCCLELVRRIDVVSVVSGRSHKSRRKFKGNAHADDGDGSRLECVILW